MSTQVSRLAPALPTAQNRPRQRISIKWPVFSMAPLLLLILAKPAADAFYEQNVVKYGYMAALLYATFFARSGLALQHGSRAGRDTTMATYLWLLAAYFFFLFGLTAAYGGTLQEVFKIVSPFIFFSLVAFASGRQMAYALWGSAILVIVANAALLPFDFGWVYWGDVRTFKGFYFFKTDLAYSLSFSVLICAMFGRYRFAPWLAFFVMLAAVQVVLANSRLNYLTFGAVLLFIGLRSGLNWRSALRLGVLLAIIGAIAAVSYDPERALGFDVSNMAVFTQGRNEVWERLINAMAQSGPLEWLFGNGLFADLRLAVEDPTSGGAHNAHNEYLHTLYTQGFVGAAFYIYLWTRTFHLALRQRPQWLAGTATAAAVFFGLQGTTAVVSSFASKTWPLVMVLLMIRSLSLSDADSEQSGVKS